MRLLCSHRPCPPEMAFCIRILTSIGLSCSHNGVKDFPCYEKDKCPHADSHIGYASLEQNLFQITAIHIERSPRSYGFHPPGQIRTGNDTTSCLFRRFRMKSSRWKRRLMMTRRVSSPMSAMYTSLWCGNSCCVTSYHRTAVSPVPTI